MSEKWKWSERLRAIPTGEIEDRLRDAAMANIDYYSQPVLGFPGTRPHPDGLLAYEFFLDKHPNNIGCHTRMLEAENGFFGTQQLEREFIYWLAARLGSRNPEVEIDGNLCSGGTDGNEGGLWIGRNKLWRDSGSQEDAIVLTSFLTHYSVAKACNKLCLRLVNLPTNLEGQLDPKVLEEVVEELYAKGHRLFIVVANAGTINLGSIDPVADICKTLASLEGEHQSHGGIWFYIHIDAAFGGYVIPFLEPKNPFGFQNERVESICVDAHKMGYTPYSAGVFMCRKGHLAAIEQEVDYLHGHTDDTTCGSRSGAAAAACWAVAQALGDHGYSEQMCENMRLLGYLESRLSEIRDVVFFPHRMNILCVLFPDACQKVLLEGGLAKRYCVPVVRMPRDPRDLTAYPEQYCIAFRFIAMPHYREEWIDKFVTELQQKVDAKVST